MSDRMRPYATGQPPERMTDETTRRSQRPAPPVKAMRRLYTMLVRDTVGYWRWRRRQRRQRR